MGVGERRARLGRRQVLAAPAATVESAVEGVVALHATDPVSLYLEARARADGMQREDLQIALYERRSLVRVLGMRRTLFVVGADLLPVVEAAAARALAAPERRRVARWLEAEDVAADGVAYLHRLEDETAVALVGFGSDGAPASDIAAVVPGLQTQIVLNRGKRYEGTVSVSSRVLLLLSMEGRAVRGRPRGSWISTQYRWVSAAAWLAHTVDLPSVDEASAELARRWLGAFGPATFEDLKWWTGWTVAQTRRALALLSPTEVDLGHTTGLVLQSDEAPVTEPDPWIALLPALDATTMGWKERDWYLGEHATALFDRNGNAGPTIWCDGRVVGGWAHRADGRIAVRLLEDIGAEAAAAVDAEAAALQAWLADTRFTPRFRTPLERELTA